MTATPLLPDVLDETVARIESLRASAPRSWGKLTLPGMLAHCRRALEMAAGERDLGRPWLGRLLGRIGKRLYVDGARPFGRNAPTDPRLIAADPGDVERERAALVAATRRYVEVGPDVARPHPFFGRLTGEEWDRVMWKHLDHHLRQFGA